MLNWQNMNTLSVYKELLKAEKVDIKAELSGENGVTRVKEYTVSLGAGLDYNYGACPVNGAILDKLAEINNALNAASTR